MSVLFVPLYTVFSQGSFTVLQSRNEILAQQHATNLLAYISLFPYNHQHLRTGERSFDNLELKMDTEALSLGIEPMFKRDLSVKEFKPANWPMFYKVVTVTISWTEMKKNRDLKVCGLVYQ
jgi:hypothetical protein